jgi:D-alanyl-D-alanine carboxypeptidase (penicillin-binding protein 5/6)
MARRLAAAFAAVTLIALTAPMRAAAGPRPRANSVESARARTVGGDLLASDGVIVRSDGTAPSLPPDSQLPASSWLVANLTTGQVLAAKAPHERFLPASTLKLLTAATLIPRLNPNAPVPVTYADEVVDGTKAGLSVGMKYKVSTLFQCMLEMSANDAAQALANAYGSIRDTLQAMNAEAKVLQANDTHADTPSGLDGPGETTSAYDLALIAQNDFANPSFQHYITQTSSEIPAAHHRHFQIQSHNDLLTTHPYRGDIGGKNGYTVAAQATYVGAATRHGQTILVTLMHGYPTWWPMATALLNWGFQATGKVEPIGQLVKPIPPPQPIVHEASALAPAAAVAGPNRRSKTVPVIEALIVMLAAFTGGMIAMRRVIPRRDKTRLSLPSI